MGTGRDLFLDPEKKSEISALCQQSGRYHGEELLLHVLLTERTVILFLSNNGLSGRLPIMLLGDGLD